MIPYHRIPGKRKGQVQLVGAGPGAVDLITLRGIRAIRKAEVILYDALVDPDLLAEAPKEVLTHYVGKRCQSHAMPQEEINSLLYQCACTYTRVVRLKGGDPFVFGRGQEECNYLRERGIEVEIIPGISSAIGVPTAQGIPVTHRGASQGFWVITGCTRERTLPADLELAAQSQATLVILMGSRKIEQIASIVAKYRDADTPVALIESGTREGERILTGTLTDIAQKVAASSLKGPGLIIMGEVVREHPQYAIEEARRNAQITA